MSLIEQVTQPYPKSYPRTPRQPEKWITAECAVCGISFTRPIAWTIKRTTYKAGRFCSSGCARKGQSHRPKTMIPATCSTCGKSFQYQKGVSGSHAYCSRPCAWAGNGKNERGPRHHGWKGGLGRSSDSKRAIQTAKKTRNKCERCGSTDNLHGHHKKHYSESVELRAEVGNIEILCSICHAQEHPELANMIQVPRKRSGITATCHHCSKEYYVPQKNAKTTKWCSRECMNLGWKGRQKGKRRYAFKPSHPAPAHHGRRHKAASNL